METISKAPSMLQLESNNMEVDKLTNQIFSILENNFLFGFDHHKDSPTKHEGLMMSPPPGNYVSNAKVRILSIDFGGSTDGLLAAESLAHLEATLRLKSGNPNAHVADFFDIVAGAGAGGVLAAMLFTRGKDGKPLFTAEMALNFIADNGREISRPSGGWFRRRFKAAKLFKMVFRELTLKDTVKGVLIPCYNLSTGAPLLFSRADALEMDGCDFKMSDVCGATIADCAVKVESVDRLTKVVAVGGAVAMSNPTAAIITHVLNNKHEFPLCKGVEDLLVVSLGNGEPNSTTIGNSRSSTESLVKISGDGVADMVDQAISMAFGKSSNSCNYVRIQGNNGLINETNNSIINDKRDQTKIAEGMLKQRNVESILFQGKKLTQTTNLDKLVTFASELINEEERRKHNILPPVVLKQASPPRTSSATTLSSVSSSY